MAGRRYVGGESAMGSRWDGEISGTPIFISSDLGMPKVVQERHYVADHIGRFVRYHRFSLKRYIP